MNVSLTYFRPGQWAHGSRHHTTWERLVERLSVSRVVLAKERAPGVSLATYRNDHRLLANVERVFAVGLDFDHLDAMSMRTERPAPGVIVDAIDWPSLTTLFDETDSVLFTTFSSTPSNPRARVFLRLSRPVTAAEYRRVWLACAGLVERRGLLVDRSASDPSRFWYLPSSPLGGRFSFSIGRGHPVDVEGALASVPETPRVLPRPPVQAGTVGNVEARAAAYLERCEIAISGQGGHTQTFLVAQKLVRGFGLDEETAFRLMLAWNERCDPPWREHDLRRKLRQAAERGTQPIGALRDAQRRAS